MLRDRGKADGRIAEFDEFAEGYPLFASPSVVRKVGGNLLFGTTALKSSGGKLYSSLKVALLSKGEHDGNAPVEMRDNAILVAAYLAWAFKQIRNSLDDDGYSNVFLNMAAPMSHFENTQLKTKYLRIVQAAWKLSFEEQGSLIKQGISDSDVASLLGPLLDAPVQSSEQRRFDVLPETIAPVVSLSLDPFMEPGMYMIVDTGAGTTEMSVFHADEASGDQKVLCYRDDTILLGGNDLLVATSQAAEKTENATVGIVNRLTRQYRRLWQEGYLLDAPNHNARRRWMELTLVLSGGGTRNVRLANELAKINPMYPWPEGETRLRVCRHEPGTLELDGRMSNGDGSLFAVANGLAIERMRWP
ncbi:MAG: hypothetical protein ACK43N_04895, partial [Pirellulaceae bacterium]